MSSHHVFLSEEWSGGLLPLNGPDEHHLRAVLRVEVGETLVVTTPSGRHLECEVDSVSEEGLRAVIERELPSRWRPQVVLCPALAKNPRMDLLVEKSTEIGVRGIIPFAADRSVVRLDEDRATKRLERWLRIAKSAAEQSGRDDIPQVEAPVSLHGLIERLADVDHILLAHIDQEAASIGEALDEAGARKDDSVALVLGPEGGLTDEEIRALRVAGARPVCLGVDVLRAETAGIVGAALVGYEMGGLGGVPRE